MPEPAARVAVGTTGRELQGERIVTIAVDPEERTSDWLDELADERAGRDPRLELAGGAKSPAFLPAIDPNG